MVAEAFRSGDNRMQQRRVQAQDREMACAGFCTGHPTTHQQLAKRNAGLEKTVFRDSKQERNFI